MKVECVFAHFKAPCCQINYTSLVHTAAIAGLGSMELEYDANKNPEIFQQLCQLDLKQVIIQVFADSCCLSFMVSAVCLHIC